MAFQQSAAPRHVAPIAIPSQHSSTILQQRPILESSQEWILFSPSHAASSTNRTPTTQTAGLSRASELGSLETVARSGRVDSEVIEEDAELDSLDEGLHAFREPPLYPVTSHHNAGAVLPTHDGLGTFPASSAPVLAQLWQHEQFNPKRKHDDVQHRTSNIQRGLNAIDVRETQAHEEKRMRIENWRIEQSQALMEEVERQTRSQLHRSSRRQSHNRAFTGADDLGTTPRQSDYMKTDTTASGEAEPFWRRITRKFIRDIIGIDDPLLSVILGESLPEEALDPTITTNLPLIPEDTSGIHNDFQFESWRDRLLRRIARELGVSVHQLSPHPGAFSTYLSNTSHADYAGMPVTIPKSRTRSNDAAQMSLERTMRTPTSTADLNFPPTLRDPLHAASWGLEEEPAHAQSASVDPSVVLKQEREYWERELDVKMVFCYLRDRFTTNSTHDAQQDEAQQRAENTARRAAVIRQHHPLVARAHRSPARLRRDSRVSVRRPGSSCASESAKGSRKASGLRSSSSRNYWDIGGSVGSHDMMGTWGEA